MRMNFQTNGEMTKLITGNRAMWINVLHFAGLLRKLAMTIHVSVIARYAMTAHVTVIARYEAIQRNIIET